MENDVRDRERPSRTALKRAAREVEDLAQKLVDLPEGQWKKLSVSEGILAEIRRARETRGHGARKRQLKHLAGVLRARPEELEALRDFLSTVGDQRLREKREFHELERLRDGLCDTERFPAALEEASRRLPELDTDAVARLARAYQTTGDVKAFREIFRRLRRARDTESSA